MGFSKKGLVKRRRIINVLQKKTAKESLGYKFFINSEDKTS